MADKTELIKVKFLKSHSSYAYFADDMGLIKAEDLEPLQKKGFVALYPGIDGPDENPLPEDLAGRAILFENGITTLEDAKALGEQGLIDLPEIGKVTAEKILSYETAD